MKCLEGRVTASGIHVVPDPIRSIETPSGSGTIIDIGAIAIEAVSPTRIDGIGIALIGEGAGLVFIPGIPRITAVSFAGRFAAEGAGARVIPDMARRMESARATESRF